MANNKKSFVEAVEVVLSVKTKEGSTYAELKCAYRYNAWKYFEEKVVNGEYHEALLQLMATKLKKKVGPKTLKFCNLNITAKFLDSLKSHVLITEGLLRDLRLGMCQLYLNQEELEDFICPINLTDINITASTLHCGAEINDKLLCSISDSLAMRQWLPFQRDNRTSHITDNLLNRWKNDPPNYISLWEMRTSFTMKSVTEAIMFLLEKESPLTWNLGVIECRSGDEEYILQLQRIPDTTVCFKEEYQIRKQFTRGYASFKFQCAFV